MADQRVAGVDAAGDLGLRTGAVALTATCAVAMYRAAAARDVASVAFVIASYGVLLLLLRSLREYELRAPPEAAVRREGLRRRVWALCTLLTVMFSWKLARVLPWPLNVAVWALGTDAVVAAFFAFFVHRAFHAA